MRAALIGASDFNATHFLSQAFDYVVAVDAGWQACRSAGVVPDVVLGDFDSLGYIPDDAAVLQFPPIKDESDMELALAHVFDASADEVCLYGALSGRLDHTIANLMLIVSAAERGMKASAIGDTYAVVALYGTPRGEKLHTSCISFAAFSPDALAGPYAPFVSVFALSGAARGVDIVGLKYPVEDFTLQSGVSRGLSNEFIGVSASISVNEGSLMVTFPLDALVYATY